MSFDRPVSRLAACCSACLAVTSAGAGDAFTEALTGGKASLDLRYRYEQVDQDNALEDAEASTVRTRLGYGTGELHGFSAFVELEDIREAFSGDFNSTTNGKLGFSTVADPEETEVNRAHLKWAATPTTTLIGGRQRVILDNARHVGNVGWRQNEQTFDAVTLTDRSLLDTTLFYGYLANINRIFGDNVDADTHLVNASYAGLPFGELTGYAYLHSNQDDPAASRRTLGLRLTGSRAAGAAELLYALEYADQADYEDGDPAIDADYLLAELGLQARAITGRAGYERLSGDGRSAFQTPLATLHAFNGWADLFLSTPEDGLVDAYGSLGGQAYGVRLLAVYHDFSSDRGDLDYGSELDLLATRTFHEHYSLGIKYAAYDAEDFGVDTDKLWIWGQIRF